jgi:hypothetical protein
MAWITQDDPLSLPPPPRVDNYCPFEEPPRASNAKAQGDVFVAGLVIAFLVWVTQFPWQAAKFFGCVLLGVIAFLYAAKLFKLGWYGFLRLTLPAVPYILRALYLLLWPVLKPYELLERAVERQAAAFRARAAAEAEFMRDFRDE